MVAAKRFLFDVTFDRTDPAGTGPDIGRAPVTESACSDEESAVIGDDDIARAHTEGVAEGRAQAAAEIAESLQRRIAETLDALADRVAGLLDNRQQDAERASADAMKVALALIRKVLPELHRRNAAGEIGLAIEQVLDRLIDQPELRIRVHERLRDAVAAGLAERIETRRLAGRVSVIADPRIAETDCRIEWAGGGAELTSAVLWREIDAVAARTLGLVAAAVPGDPNPEGAKVPPGTALVAFCGPHSRQDEQEHDHG